jgi:hypothetical protein
VCTANVCQAPTCTDGVQNGTETGLDCGGATCPACPAGQGCSTSTDCQSLVCVATDAGANVCLGATCSDGVKNGTETDVDCGGGTCPACSNGKACQVSSDCQSVDCVSGVCSAPSCHDGVQDGQETDVDCGGPSCAPCQPTQGCQQSRDCTSFFCTLNDAGTGGTCAYPSCSDGVLNGNEVGIDCGGGVCPGCLAGGPCNVANDCSASAPYCVNHLCYNHTDGLGHYWIDDQPPGTYTQQEALFACSLWSGNQNISAPCSNIDCGGRDGGPDLICEVQLSGSPEYGWCYGGEPGDVLTGCFTAVATTWQ